MSFMSGEQFRTGDVLTVSCPFTPAVIASATPAYVFVRWPWWTKDPDLEWVDWNGAVALSRRPGTHDWTHELFRTETDPGALDAGDACRVGIPPTTVHVLNVFHHDPPQETGWLPRPRRHLWLLRHGLSVDPEADDQGCTFDPDDDIPTEITVTFRPFAFLQPGDEVTDAAGHAWRFDDPWHWYPHDRATSGAPVWPLTLHDDSRSDAVAAATRTGSHETELTRWRDASGAEPPRCRLRAKKSAWSLRRPAAHHACGHVDRDE